MRQPSPSTSARACASQVARADQARIVLPQTCGDRIVAGVSAVAALIKSSPTISGNARAPRLQADPANKASRRKHPPARADECRHHMKRDIAAVAWPTRRRGIVIALAKSQDRIEVGKIVRKPVPIPAAPCAAAKAHASPGRSHASRGQAHRRRTGRTATRPSSHAAGRAVASLPRPISRRWAQTADVSKARREIPSPHHNKAPRRHAATLSAEDLAYAARKSSTWPGRPLRPTMKRLRSAFESIEPSRTPCAALRTHTACTSPQKHNAWRRVGVCA